MQQSLIDLIDSLPALSLLEKFRDLKEVKTVPLKRGDTLLVFMQPHCPDSIELSRQIMERSASDALFSSSCSVVYVNAMDDGRILTDRFQDTEMMYPMFRSSDYAKLADGRTVMPKVYIIGKDSSVDGVYYQHHGEGFESFDLDEAS